MRTDPTAPSWTMNSSSNLSCAMVRAISHKSAVATRAGQCCCPVIGQPGMWALPDQAGHHHTTRPTQASKRLPGRCPLPWQRPCAPALPPVSGAVQIEELRLAGGPSPYEGRVELRLANNSEWGTLCGTWSTDSDAQLAQVVCRQLGFEPSRALARGGGIYGGSSLQAAATAIACTGEEELLEDCRLKLESQGCEWGSPAFGVSCNGALLMLVGAWQSATEVLHGNSGAELLSPAFRSCWVPTTLAAVPELQRCVMCNQQSSVVFPRLPLPARRLPRNHRHPPGGRPVRQAGPAGSTAAGQ